MTDDVSSTWWRSPTVVWLVSTTVLTAALLAVSVPDLGRYPRVHGDDIWVMSASYKLATSGVFGSDMYRGFAGADQHYFIVLPVYPFLQALSFTLFGAGIEQARLVTLASAVVVLWATTWLALRSYGRLAAIVAGLLLVLLRVNLVDLWPGIPLVSVGRSGRYDTTAVAFVWLTVVFLDLTIRNRNGRWRSAGAYLAGACAGLATLTQFFGIFSILLVPALLLWRGERLIPTSTVVRIGATWIAVVSPYLAYATFHWSDFRGQSALISGRTTFHRPRFYLDNLRDEAARYQHLFAPDRITGDGFVTWMFIVAIVPVLGWLAWRARCPFRTGDRLLLTSLLVFAVSLALVDSTNVPIYTVVLWPGCCIALAAASARGLGALSAQFRANHVRHQRPVVVSIALLTIAVAALVVADSVEAYREDRALARTVSAYEIVAADLDAVIPARTGVIGHQRWWWGLHERDYLALNALVLEWEEMAREAGEPPSFTALFDATGAGALLIDDNARSEIGRYPEDLRWQIDAFLSDDAVQAAVITDPTYGRFEVYLRRH